MQNYAAKIMTEDPFKLLSVGGPKGELIEKLMKENGLPFDDSTTFSPKENEASSSLPGEGRHGAFRSERLAKTGLLFCWGLGGGLSLRAPMLLMRLHKTLLTQLLTTGISVMIFALGLAIPAGGAITGAVVVDIGPQDVLTATAACSFGCVCFSRFLTIMNSLGSFLPFSFFIVEFAEI
jgi:hypothetical protein